ncbi:MAG: sodium:solute symporter family protein [Rikenellaceae bacterium]
MDQLIAHADKIVIATGMLLYIVAVSYIGYRNKRSQNSEDYFLASRSLPSWLLSITFIASWWGGGSAIDLVDHAHGAGISSFWIYGVPVLISTFLIYILSAGIRRVATISQPELIEKRYDSRVAFMLSLFIIIFMTLGSAVQVIVIGNLFQSLFGLDYTMGAVVGTLLVLFYSLFGGFRGVVLTDLLQFLFFLFSSLFLFAYAWSKSGGFQAVELLALQPSHQGFTSFFHNVGDNLAYVITFGCSWMIQANVWQRVSAAKSPKSARKMMAISFVAFIPLYLMVTVTGMFSAVIYDVVPAGGVVANLLLGLENPLLTSVIFIGLCSAVMSTMDSMFNSGALSIAIDIYQRHIAPSASAARLVLAGRLSTALVALVALFVGVNIKSVLTISWIGADFLATGAFVPLVLGFVWRRGTSAAALCSMLFGLLFSLYNLAYAMGVDLPVMWEIASARQALVGMCSSLVIYVLVSISTRAELEKADEFISLAGVVKR